MNHTPLHEYRRTQEHEIAGSGCPQLTLMLEMAPTFPDKEGCSTTCCMLLPARYHLRISHFETISVQNVTRARRCISCSAVVRHEQLPHTCCCAAGCSSTTHSMNPSYPYYIWPAASELRLVVNIDARHILYAPRTRISVPETRTCSLPVASCTVTEVIHASAA